MECNLFSHLDMLHLFNIICQNVFAERNNVMSQRMQRCGWHQRLSEWIRPILYSRANGCFLLVGPSWTNQGGCVQTILKQPKMTLKEIKLALKIQVAIAYRWRFIQPSTNADNYKRQFLQQRHTGYVVIDT